MVTKSEMNEDFLGVWKQAELQRLAGTPNAQLKLEGMLREHHPTGRIPFEHYATAYSIAQLRHKKIETMKWHIRKYIRQGLIERNLSFDFGLWFAWFMPSCPLLVAKFKIPEPVSFEDALNNLSY